MSQSVREHALLRDPTHGQLVQRVLQGAIPDLVYTNPGEGKEMMVEVKFINQCPTRYRREVATSLRASVNTREQQ